jgi:hypothetical protein
MPASHTQLGAHLLTRWHTARTPTHTHVYTIGRRRREEKLAASMYLLICRGKVPLRLDLDRIRAAIAAARAAT